MHERLRMKKYCTITLRFRTYCRDLLTVRPEMTSSAGSLITYLAPYIPLPTAIINRHLPTDPSVKYHFYYF